jgi:nitrite reductase/ring-hydroxylating ferredoxin subunit
MPFRRVAALAEAPPGAMLDVDLGDRRIAVCNVAGELHAVDGTCPHRQGPLAHGALHGAMVVCPWHAWEFDCRTGRHDYDPSLVLRRYAVRDEGGSVMVDID